VRYLLITEPRSLSSVRVDMHADELPEETLRRFLGDTNPIVVEWQEQSEMEGLIEWYEEETHEKVEFINETRHVPAPDPFDLIVRRLLKPLAPQEWTTGGGCMAWRFDIRDGDPENCGLHALITDDDGTHHIGDPEAPMWMVGLYPHGDDDDGEHIELHTDQTLAQCIAKITEWRKQWARAT